MLCSFYYVFDDFPKISENFKKCSEGQTNVPNILREFGKFTKMCEDFRRLPKIFEVDPKMFR